MLLENLSYCTDTPVTLLLFSGLQHKPWNTEWLFNTQIAKSSALSAALCKLHKSRENCSSDNRPSWKITWELWKVYTTLKSEELNKTLVAAALVDVMAHILKFLHMLTTLWSGYYAQYSPICCFTNRQFKILSLTNIFRICPGISLSTLLCCFY